MIQPGKHTQSTINSPQSIIEQQAQEIKLLKEQNALLKHELAQLKRLIFGSKSERFTGTDNPDQLQIELAGIEANAEAEVQPPAQTISYTRKTPENKRKSVRTPIPEHLPRIEEVIEPENIPQGAKRIGAAITELLEYNPGKIFVRKIVRPKYALPQDNGVTIGKLPIVPIPKGNAGAGLLSHILVSKFIDHLPYYRQQQIFKRSGLEIAKTTFNGWFNASCDLLLPLYECLKQKVLASDYLMGDESPIPVQDSDKKGKTHTGYHWVYHAPLERLVLFDYREDRSRAGPQQLLKDFKGKLQTDGYVAYESLEKTHHIILLACMAHARRKFEQSLDNDRVRAEYMLVQIGKLYEIERIARENDYSYEQRKALRKEKSVVILNTIEKWLKGNLTEVLPKSPIGQAISYTLNLWPRLIRYVEYGECEIDNNFVENSIRPLALGRKNYLFAGSHQAAKRAAMMYSFFGTCKKNNIEPFEWLRNTLQVLPETKMTALDTLLPIEKKS